MSEDQKKASSGEHVHILITQCLQNSFFLSRESHLCLPDEAVRQMLVGTKDMGAEETKNNKKILADEDIFEGIDENHPARRRVKQALLQQGPLYQFLNALLDDNRPNDLYIINVKDWHVPSETYDRERRFYGTHCEAGTWGAKCIDGLEPFLEPWRNNKNVKNPPQTEMETYPSLDQGPYVLKEHKPVRDEVTGKLRKPAKTYLYEIRSNTLFDFQPVLKQENIDGDMTKSSVSPAPLTRLLDELIGEEQEWENKRVYMAVIGVYTDIKIKTLLTGLRSRYIIHNLILSDVLTASPTLERHLSGLDYADKVLQVEIMHSLNALADVLHPGNFRNPIDPDITKLNPDFHDYRNYYLDQQKVLSYSDAKLEQYINLTSNRMTRIYRDTTRANRVVIWFGYAFLGISLLAVIFTVFAPLLPEDIRPDTGAGVALAGITGGLGLVGLISNFIFDPLNNMRENLYSVVRLRNYLESYSTVTALMRHHLTAPEYLNDESRIKDPEKALKHLRIQMGIMDEVAETMMDNYQALRPTQARRWRRKNDNDRDTGTDKGGGTNE